MTPYLRSVLGTPISLFARCLPTALLQRALVEVAVRHSEQLSPSAGLRFLLDIDGQIYQYSGKLAIRYGNGVHTKHRHMQYHEFFVQRIAAHERVLDIGCGYGALAYSVAVGTGAQILAIDLNPDRIAQAQERFPHPRVSYQVRDALKMQLDANYDVVILSNVLEHLPSRPQFLQRVTETLRPARMLIRVPLFERDWRVPLKRELGIEWRLDPTHETEYTLETFQEEIDEAGLTIHHIECRWGEIWSEVHTNVATC